MRSHANVLLELLLMSLETERWNCQNHIILHKLTLTASFLHCVPRKFLC
jgi:hypothetical protein